MYRIVYKKQLNPAVVMMDIYAPLVAKKALAGQFIILRAIDDGERIPLTVAGYDREKGTVRIIFQVVGATTLALSYKEVGDSIPDFVGPLGRPTKTEGVNRVLIVGGGVKYSEAWETARFFAEKFNIPIGETQAGKGNIRWDIPLNMGGVGVTGGPAANAIAKQADLIIAVGTRLTDFTTCSKWGFHNPDCKMLSINVCSFDAFKMDSTAVIADAKEACEAITAKLYGYKSKWTDEIETAKKAYKENISLKEACVELGFLTAERFDEVFHPEEMALIKK